MTSGATTLRVKGKTIELHCSEGPAPLVVYHSVMGEGDRIWKACRKAGCPEFSFASVDGVVWDDDMTPWPIPPISKGDTPCGGLADAYLEELTGDILPKIEEALPSPPEYRVLSGYSLAGLFAVYAAYRTDVFTRIVSGSGSLWYPDFVGFAEGNRISEAVEAIYLSLGDKESHTRNPYLASVEENTRALAEHFSGLGIRTVFEMNRGNHYCDSSGRTARGIKWALEQEL